MICLRKNRPRAAGRWLALGLSAVVSLLPLSLRGAVVVAGPSVLPVSTTNAVVTWTTDVATRGVVRYGLSLANLDQTAEEDDVQGKHSVKLTGLRPGARYHYVVATARVPLATNAFVMPAAGTSAPVPLVATRPRESASPGVPAVKEAARVTTPRAPPTRESWGQMASLQDHYERHGPDFQARDADDYARQAWEFLQRARQEGLPAKVDDDGVVRIYDPKTRAFAAYNRNGTTKTFFKPNSRDYFERQPGRPVNAKTLKF